MRVLKSNSAILLGRVLSTLVTIFVLLDMHASPVWAASIDYGNPPPGFRNCAGFVADPACVVDPDAPPLLIETATTAEELRRTNVLVNQAIELVDGGVKNGPIGQSNYWRSYAPPYTKKGNCINYAATKKRILLPDGKPSNGLRFAVVHPTWVDDKNVFHVILLVYTDKFPDDPYVLDSMARVSERDIIQHLSTVMATGRYTILQIQNQRGAWLGNMFNPLY